jgi:hypothetical protein
MRISEVLDFDVMYTAKQSVQRREVRSDELDTVTSLKRVGKFCLTGHAPRERRDLALERCVAGGQIVGTLSQVPLVDDAFCHLCRALPRLLLLSSTVCNENVAG